MSKKEIIDKLTQLLIKQDFKDKQTGKTEYISKVGAFRSLIKLIKECYDDEEPPSRKTKQI